MKHITHIAGILAAFVIGSGLCTGVAHAQSVTYSFSGRIVVPEPHFDYPPMEVRLLGDDFNGRTLAFTYSDDSGYYSFTGLAGGTYYVAVKLDGYQEDRHRVDLTVQQLSNGPGGNNLLVAGVNFMLTPNSSNLPEPRGMKEATDAYKKALDERGKGNFDVAANQLESVLKLVPDYPNAHTELGEVYQELKRRDDAEREYRKARELDPELSRPLVDLGRLYLEVSEEQLAKGASPGVVTPMFARAHDVLTEAVMRNPKSAAAEYLLGTVDFRTGSYDTAESELKRALTLDTKIVPAKIMLINVYVVQKKWENAVDMLDNVILENPTSPYVDEAKRIRASVVRRLVPNPEP